VGTTGGASVHARPVGRGLSHYQQLLAACDVEIEQMLDEFKTALARMRLRCRSRKTGASPGATS